MDQALQRRITKCVHYMTSHGYSVVPLGDDKRPSQKWGEYVGNPMLPERFPLNSNVALLTGAENGVVVVDCDTMESAALWGKKSGTKTNLTVKTRRGMHYYYRHPGVYIKSGTHIPIGGTTGKYDVKGERSYVVFPPSMFAGHQYQFLPSDQNPAAIVLDFKTLPEFDPAWRPEASTNDGMRSRVGGITDPLAYIRQIHAVSGNGGHNDTFRAVCKLHEGGFTETEAIAAMAEWNQTNATPKWSLRDLIHKVKSVYK